MQSANNVMVLYTGGTIGMQASANGLAPASGFEARMREQLADAHVPAWRFQEMAPLIDSANMTPAYWQRLRTAVIDATDAGCDAVLILHGTDTLAYSAAAMSFQLLGLPVPVVFTGSMLPAGVPDSDAWENVSGALAALGTGLAPGVHLHFHGALLAPTACAKVRSFGRNPFAALKRQGGVARATALPAALDYRQPKTLASVGVLPLVPGIGAAQLDGLIDSGIHGLILECFGSGTGPSDDPDFLAGLQRAQDKEIVVVAITQCHEGGVELDIYEAGSRLRGVGVLSGGGMTREAAFGKLNALLGAGLDHAEVRRLVEGNLCGELG
ncbi:asparaginase [Pseudomonas trivialis]|uniref:asparaginase n=1 Tax=Pseudomonas trivialis TaxID=200450 RepID=A0A0R2ZXR8_9PSED|nr:asparaginase [Pseudomonas trivialis]KRP62977.1 asparaginase [Pseudomonas trivialis]SDS04931.1 L-asparaginase [Pseudomonas trivialis]